MEAAREGLTHPSWCNKKVIFYLVSNNSLTDACRSASQRSGLVGAYQICGCWLLPVSPVGSLEGRLHTEHQHPVSASSTIYPCLGSNTNSLSHVQCHPWAKSLGQRGVVQHEACWLCLALFGRCQSSAAATTHCFFLLQQLFVVPATPFQLFFWRSWNGWQGDQKVSPSI